MLIAGQGRGERVGRRYSGRVMQKREVVYNLPQISGHSGRDVNGKCFFDLSHWKIPGNSEKVVPFSRLGRSEWKFVFHLQVSLVSY